MYRDDWLDWSGAVVVLVRANAVRSLKTKHGRRQVPLVEMMTASERGIVDEVLRRWELTHKAGASAPLLPRVDKESYWSVKAAVSEQLLQVLKAATRSSAARIHGLRHSFVCRLLALLVGRDLGPGLSVNAAATQHVRRLLLGRDKLDRRAMWAIARALEHSNCSVGISCYLHGIELWAEPAEPSAEWDGWGVTPNPFINLDATERDAGYRGPLKFTPAPPLSAQRWRFGVSGSCRSCKRDTSLIGPGRQPAWTPMSWRNSSASCAFFGRSRPPLLANCPQRLS